MMRANHLRSTAVQAPIAAALLAAIAAPSFAGRSQGPTPTTPAGVTLVEVVRELPISQPQILWVRPGDAQGRTLLISENDQPGVSRCAAECAKEFPPLVAPRGAKASGDWSVIRRPDGIRQWAYQSHPLYTWTKEQQPGEVATNVGLTETANAKLAEDPVTAGSLMPPAGWQVARFLPAEELMLPDGIDARLVNSVQAVALTNGAGLTLYAFDGDARHDNQVCASTGCEIRWRPLLAPALASDMGDFSVVHRSDGTRQWAFRKKPLYTFPEDKLPGDVHGVGVDKKWNVVVVTESFKPADVSVRWLEGYGAALTYNGMTLYGGYSFEKRWGGRNLRDTFTNAYYKGKKLGPAACVDESCLRTWRPLLAPADAQPSGFWEPVKRDDGSVQWAYKGYALYTYAGDKLPGQHNGQATYDFAKVEGDESVFKRAAYLQGISEASGGVGVYWNIAKP